MTGRHKLLIMKGAATVAEVRQGDKGPMEPKNKKKRVLLKEISQERMKMQVSGAHALAIVGVSGVGLLRHYIDLHPSPKIRSYTLCDCVNGMRCTWRRTLPG